MKPTTDFHREALDQALRVALGTSQPALRQQALARAALHIVHPNLILESSLLTDTHPWRREALVVADAFEAVTNGMEQPGSLEALDSLDPQSPFQPWRHLILAIHFYYENLDEAVAAHLARVPSISPLQALVRLLESLTSGAHERLTAPQRALADQVAQADPLIHQWVQDVAEGLETDDEELFWAALVDWLETVAWSSPDRARSAVLWAWNQLEWREFDEATLLALGTSLWGRAESYRLAALGTLPWDPEGAALLWIRFLICAAREGAEDSVLRGGHELLLRFQGAAEEVGDLEPRWRETWSSLCGAWNAEALARQLGALVLVDQPVQPPPTHPFVPAADGQLDLFT